MNRPKAALRKVTKLPKKILSKVLKPRLPNPFRRSNKKSEMIEVWLDETAGIEGL